MKSERIQKWSLCYCLFRFYVIFVHRLYYREIVVLGRENLPKSGPVIFSPNHQNALMDALAVACTVPRQTVFLARADLFRRRLFAKVLAFFKIMPVYRIRDGYANLAKNEECFAKAVAILSAGKSICLMPEGNHGNQRNLRPFSKGIFRIALRAQEKNGEAPFVNIVPVGLDYNDYSGFRARLMIRIGAPIDVSSYFPAYRNNPARAFHGLCNHLRGEMKRLMLHVESAGHYETIWTLKEIYRDRMFLKMRMQAKSTDARFSVDQCLLEVLDEKATNDEWCLTQIEPRLNLFGRLASELRLRPAHLDDAANGSLVLAMKSALYLCVLPLIAYGFVNNIISYCVTARVARSVKDPQFQSSLKCVSGVFVVPIVSISQALLLLWLCHSFVLCVAYIISIYVTGIMAFDLYVAAVEHVSRMRYRWALYCRRPQYLELKRTHEEIVGFMDALVH
jgi:1-acyl-sn-glycerol-3-phosphate acyltransferase